MRQLSEAARSLGAARADEGPGARPVRARAGGMETPSDMDDEATPRRASEWLAALLERPDDDALRRRIDAWTAADPANAADWAEIARTYEVIGRTPPAHRDEWAGYAAGRGGGAGRWRWPRRAAVGLAAALAACLLLAAIPAFQLRLIADHVTATAELRTVLLDDGSSVRLGPESAIAVAYAARERAVRLLRGQAFFQVVPDPDRPFRVRASLVEATVLGTDFEMRLDDRGAGVAVRRGSVRVESDDVVPPALETLAAGDWVALAVPGGVTRGVQPPGRVAAWLQGRLIAKDRPVDDVVDELRRYYGGLVILRGEALAGQPLTGIYDLSDPLAALEAVAAALDAKLYRLTPWLLVISAG